MNEDGEHYKEIAALLSQYCTQIRKAVLQKDKAEVSDVEGMHKLSITSVVFVGLFPMFTLVHHQILIHQTRCSSWSC